MVFWSRYPLSEAAISLFSVQLKWPPSPQELSTPVRTTCRSRAALSSQPRLISLHPGSVLPSATSFISARLRVSHSSATGGGSFSAFLLCTFRLFFSAGSRLCCAQLSAVPAWLLPLHPPSPRCQKSSTLQGSPLLLTSLCLHM